jgi:hypothetical protein
VSFAHQDADEKAGLERGQAKRGCRHGHIVSPSGFS